MKNEKNIFETLGWTLTNPDFKPPFNFKSEINYWIKRFLIDILSFIPFLILLTVIYIQQKTHNSSQKKILLGTHPLINFKNLTPVLRKKFSCDVIVFEDWSKGNFHDGLVLKDFMPSWLNSNQPYWLGGYFGILWALKNYSVLGLYANSGFLERTIWWRLEPIIYQLFSKKILIFPYVTSNYDLYSSNNRTYKLALSISEKRKFFALDEKRVKRNYWWAKYVNFVFGYSNIIDNSPRCDALAISGNVIPLVEPKIATFTKDNIKILHISNDKIRKGSKLISNKMIKLTKQYKNISYEEYEKIPQTEFNKKREDTHIYIEQLIDGIFSYSAVEAMLLGKIVISYVEDDLIQFYKNINPDYYETFFDEFPLVIANPKNFESKVEELIKVITENSDSYTSYALKCHQSAKQLVKNNEEIYLTIFQKVIDAK